MERQIMVRINTIKVWCSWHKCAKPEENTRQKTRGRLLTYFVDGDSVHIGVIHKPDDLIGEEFSVILRGQVGLSGLGGVELQTLADALPQHIQGRVGFHDFSHGLLDQRLAARKPISIGTA